MKFLGKLLNAVGHDERVGGIGVTNLRNGAFASAGDAGRSGELFHRVTRWRSDHSTELQSGEVNLPSSFPSGYEMER